ncbi:MAG: reverse transcriptase [Bacteroidaceae bacterium]|nr:reverse transcriptase [Bacteroidaceae bacterium]
MSNGNTNNNNRNNSNRVRAVCLANEPITYDITLDSIVEAFYDCIATKKSNNDCIVFMTQYQEQLHQLWEDVCYARYRPSTISVFMKTWPVLREIGAAEFIDRVMQHWWFLRVNPIIEQRYRSMGNVSKNCRKNQGQKAAVDDAKRMVAAHPDWYVGKFDLKGCFMSVDKQLAWEMMDIFIRDNYHGSDIECLLYVNSVLICHNAQLDYRIKGNSSSWSVMPKDKSLIAQPVGWACPVGDLVSQVMVNFMLSAFDEYVTAILGYREYIRFSDDFVIFASTREELLQLVPKMDSYLREQLHQRLHPKKIHIQPVAKGFQWIGTIIHTNRVYISNRTRGRMYSRIYEYNRLAEAGRALDYVENFAQSMNSYLGMMVHYNSYNIRKKVMYLIHPEWWKYVQFDGHCRKFIVKKKFRQRSILRNQLRSGGYKSMLTPELES